MLRPCVRAVTATTAIVDSTSILVLFAVILVGWIVYAFFNIRQSRDELGSEIELAPNRKPYYDDEVLEGRRLERVLSCIGVLLLVVIVVGLPLYWVLEPSRQAGASEAQERAVRRVGVAAVRTDRPTAASTAPAATAA